MRLLRLQVDGSPLYKDGHLNLDLYATDRVMRGDDGFVQDVFQLNESIYSQNILGVVGINAAGKTTTLNFLKFVLGYLAGPYSTRGFSDDRLLMGKMNDVIVVTAVFWEKGSFYLLESTIKHALRNAEDSACGGFVSVDSFSFKDETLWELSSGRINRSTIGDSDSFKARAKIICMRNGDKNDPRVLDDHQRLFLDDKTSIASAVTGKLGVSVESPDRKLPTLTMPTEVIRAFDASVEYLKWDAQSQVFHLKFKNEESERVVSDEVATQMLSRGTVVGAELVEHAITALHEGGYLIVDEIEMGLNRSLVGTVVGLFSSPVTNPRGAQLVFSTHYSELLDAIKRKDNVYLLVRDSDYSTEAVKYSDKIKRIENKKSEVLLNNVIKGSMPRYPDVQAMKLYVKRRVSDE